ncbi:hypothetical protein [Escherichia coli]|uniref:hypothetical protein n=1 Tax=Escherichia coli TaxID=562 RepID=UPI0010CB8DCA|nr:hypothetical protein [Escherichia coli]
MINNIANQSSFPAATIDSQMLLKMVNEARKLCGEKPVRNNDFIARVKDELDGEYYEIFVVQKLNNTTSETISMTYKQALRVAARESKAVRRSLVDQLESMQQQLQQKITSKYSTNGLEEFRKARALKMTVDTMKDLFGFLPNLAPEAKQVVAASLVNPVVGANVIPLPMINEHYYSASEVGSQLKISANKVGRIANTEPPRESWRLNSLRKR